MRATVTLLSAVLLLAASASVYGQGGLQNPAGFQAPGGNNNPPGSFSAAATSSPLGGTGGGSLPSLSSVPGLGLSGGSSNPALSGIGIRERESGGFGRPRSTEGRPPFDEQRAIKEQVVGAKLAGDWRYVLYEGRHWYWMPDDTWRVWVGNSWEPYTAGMFNRTPAAYGPQARAYRYSGPNAADSGRLSDMPTDVRRIVPGTNGAPAKSSQTNQAELNRARAKALELGPATPTEPTDIVVEPSSPLDADREAAPTVPVP